MLLSNEKFQEYLQIKYEHDFDLVVPDRDLQELFKPLSGYINTDIYVKLLSFIDMWDFDNFQRFLFVCIRNFYDEQYAHTDIENIKEHVLLQIFCLVCLQYYFL